MGIHTAPEVGDDALAEPRDQRVAAVGGERQQHDHGEQPNQRTVEKPRIARGEALIHQGPETESHHQHRGRGDDQRQGRARHRQTVRRDEAPQALERGERALGPLLASATPATAVPAGRAGSGRAAAGPAVNGIGHGSGQWLRLGPRSPGRRHSRAFSAAVEPVRCPETGSQRLAFAGAIGYRSPFPGAPRPTAGYGP